MCIVAVQRSVRRRPRRPRLLPQHLTSAVPLLEPDEAPPELQTFAFVRYRLLRPGNKSGGGEFVTIGTCRPLRHAFLSKPIRPCEGGGVFRARRKFPRC
ncbi:hypothetical protein MTP99_010247 [Tenebrio molitor]|jgi:hypothetical protein|nr:hypothetical protein MTP99_010247 [Tenebrio molitor]